jgi:transposase
VLTAEERGVLERLTNRRKTAQAMALRARIVLACAEKAQPSNQEVARRLHVNHATVGKWRRRFVAERLDGLSDDPRPGAPRKITDDKVETLIVKTLEETPLDATHWSTRSMAQKAGVSASWWDGSGGRPGYSPTATRPSSCPPIRSSSKSCVTWSACILTRRCATRRPLTEWDERTHSRPVAAGR